MTIPLWTLPLPVIAVALIDWLVEQFRKFGAGRSTTAQAPRQPNGGELTAVVGADIPRVQVLARSKPFDQDAA